MEHTMFGFVVGTGKCEVYNILLIAFKNNNKIIFIIDKVLFGNSNIIQTFNAHKQHFSQILLNSNCDF